MLIPCGVALPASRASLRRAPFRIAYCGRLWSHQKRIELVTDALIHACRTDRIEPVLLGDGYARQACGAKVQQAGLS